MYLRFTPLKGVCSNNINQDKRRRRRKTKTSSFVALANYRAIGAHASALIDGHLLVSPDHSPPRVDHSVETSLIDAIVALLCVVDASRTASVTSHE